MLCALLQQHRLHALHFSKCGWKHDRVQGRDYLRRAGFHPAEESYVRRDFFEAKAKVRLSLPRNKGVRDHNDLVSPRGSLCVEWQTWLACRMRGVAMQFRENL